MASDGNPASPSERSVYEMNRNSSGQKTSHNPLSSLNDKIIRAVKECQSSNLDSLSNCLFI